MVCKGLISASLLGVFLICPRTAPAAEFERQGLWGGLELREGKVHESFPGETKNETLFSLAIDAGYALAPNLILGIELSGWNKEPSDREDPAKGEGIGEVFAIARYYPFKNADFFIKAAGGYVSHWNNRPGEPRRKSGSGFSLGLGYDFALGHNAALTPVLTYTEDKPGDEKLTAFMAGIGVNIFQ